MARLFIFGIGGTGSRVIKSLTMLLSGGIKPGKFDEIVPIIVDPHKELQELNDCKRLIRLYSRINEIAYGENSEISEGFFRTRMTTLKAVSTDQTLKDDIEFDEKSNESFGDFINKTGIRKISPKTLDFLSLLYSDANFSQPLKVGFKGNPHMGSIVLNSLFGGKAFNTFKSIFGQNDRIFIISSVFGGTGAAGFPLLLKNFRHSDKPEIRDCQIGALSVLPYFKLSEAKETSDIDSNDFMTKTKSALSYYNNPDFTNLYNSIYYIADFNGQSEPYLNDEINQPDKAHLIELLGALAIIHFAENSNNNKGDVKEYCLGGDVESVSFGNIGNSTRDIIKSGLSSLHLFSKIHPVIKENSKRLAFCKVNDFNNEFFDDNFFTDQETGIEIFFDEFYSKWISELEQNQRSFRPFNLKDSKTYRNLVVGDKLDKHFWDGIFTVPVDSSDLLNKISRTITEREVRLLKEDYKNCQYLTVCWKGTKKFVKTHFKAQENGKL